MSMSMPKMLSALRSLLVQPHAGPPDHTNKPRNHRATMLYQANRSKYEWLARNSAPPSTPWSPETHHLYPCCMREAVRTWLLVCHRPLAALGARLDSRLVLQIIRQIVAPPTKADLKLPSADEDSDEADDSSEEAGDQAAEVMTEAAVEAQQLVVAPAPEEDAPRACSVEIGEGKFNNRKAIFDAKPAEAAASAKDLKQQI